MPVLANPLGYTPPWWLANGWLMTVYVGLWAGATWQQQTARPAVSYQDLNWHGADGVPLYAQGAIAATADPAQPKGTIIGTYGVTGSLADQWILQVLGRHAIARDYAVILFDWRGHGETGRRSPQVCSDGLDEGRDYLHLAAQAKAHGYPPPYWFLGYSLGGQLALWGIHYATPATLATVGLTPQDIGGAAVLCPNLDAERSLTYLMAHPVGRHIERAIAKTLRHHAIDMATRYPQHFDRAAVAQVDSIRGFDQVMVIPKLGFDTVTDYYLASSPLPWLDQLAYPTFMLYAEDDPLFIPDLLPELRAIAQRTPHLHLWLTPQGGHVGYISSPTCQRQWGDRDQWWAWHRTLDWLDQQAAVWSQAQSQRTPVSSPQRPSA